MLTKSIDLKRLLSAYSELKNLADKIINCAPDELETNLTVLIVQLKSASRLVELWNELGVLFADDFALNAYVKSEIAIIGRSLAAVGHYLLQLESPFLKQYERLLKDIHFLTENHNFKNLQEYWHRFEALIMTRPEQHDYPDLIHPFTFWYISLKMNEIFTKHHILESHFIDWIVPKHLDLLSRDTYLLFIDTLIENQSHVVRLIHTLLMINMGDTDDENYKHQERMDGALQRALFHGNLEVANGITQPAPYGLA